MWSQVRRKNRTIRKDDAINECKNSETETKKMGSMSGQVYPGSMDFFGQVKSSKILHENVDQAKNQ